MQFFESHLKIRHKLINILNLKIDNFDEINLINFNPCMMHQNFYSKFGYFIFLNIVLKFHNLFIIKIKN